MKATRRQSGQLKFTIKVEFHVGRDELMKAIVHNASIYGPATLRSRGGVMALVRSTLADAALAQLWADDPNAEGDFTPQDGYAIIDKLFPELP